MAALRCTSCDLNLPKWNEHVTCPSCKGETWDLGEDDFDPDWKDKLAELRKTKYTPLPIPNAHISTVEYDGRKWVAHQNLLNAGYGGLCDFDVVKIHGRFYELQAHIGKTAENLPGGGWWIEEIDPDAHYWNEDIPLYVSDILGG